MTVIYYLRPDEGGEVEMIVSGHREELDTYREQFHVTVYELNKDQLIETGSYQRLKTEVTAEVQAADDGVLQPPDEPGDKKSYHSTIQFGYE